jgi:hypothetical protein
MGHHLGGVPIGGGQTWPSLEGEADYYATAKCLRRVFADEDNEAALRGQTIDPSVREKCERGFALDKDRLICERSALAGLSAARLLFELDGRGHQPQFSTPDTREVAKTEESHPEPQCRLDTYVAGAICKVGAELNPDASDATLNVCAQGREAEGYRPRCWFHP